MGQIDTALGKTTTTRTGTTEGNASSNGGDDSEEASFTTSGIDEHLRCLKQLRVDLELASAKLNDDDQFFDLVVRILDLTGEIPVTICDRLSISQSTLSRWTNKRTAPRPPKKSNVYKELKAIVKRELRAFKKLAATT